MIDLDNQTELYFDIKALEAITSTLTNKDIELIITNDETIKNINNKYRGKDASTDVLSFPIDIPYTEPPFSSMPLGSIVISEIFVRKQAKVFKHSNDSELTLLFIHGLLHLLGYDHEVDNGEMRKKEKELIEQFDLPKSLITREEEK